jgi:SdrD B-like domain/Secretion system C-terminal sorting domain
LPPAACPDPLAPKPNSIGNYVWLDSDHDGNQDSTEVGIAGVTVTLYDNTGNVVATTVSDAYGAYLFKGLPDGSYQVGFTAPANHAATLSLTSGDNANNTNSDLNSITGKTGLFALAGGETDLTADAGFYVPQAVDASLGDYVWNDINKDGIQNIGESPISGVTVTLYNAVGISIATTVTDANGKYKFENLVPGTYSVGISPPVGYVISPTDITGATLNANNAADFTDSDISSTTGRTANVNLVAGENNPGLDAGLFLQDPFLGAIGNFVWNDINHDGLQNFGEPGVPGVTVNLLNSVGAVIVTTLTDAFGQYIFNNLPAGTYGVQFVVSTLPAGFSFTLANTGSNDEIDSDPILTGLVTGINLSAGEIDLSIDAGIFNATLPLNGLGNYVWYDTNGDGIQSPTEAPVPGVTVILYNAVSGLPIDTTTTNTSGNYSFNNLPDGTYSVGFSNLPSSYGFTLADIGGNSLDSDVGLNWKTNSIALAGGQFDNTLDAGIVPTNTNNATASLGDKVWDDLNNDGIQQIDEQGVGGVAVTLYASDGTTVLFTTITDPLGNYIFTNLPSGDYVVGFTSLPSGFSFSAAGQGTDPSKDANADAETSGKTAIIHLNTGEENLTIDAGIHQAAGLARLGNFVWIDSDGDGLQSIDETGIPGITVKLYATNGTTVLATTVTDATGFYQFAGLVPDTYLVGFSNLPNGYEFTEQDAAGASTNGLSGDQNDSDVNGVTGLTNPVTLIAGQNYPDLDAGIFTSQASLGNYVWNDLNNDGIQDLNEKGIAGITVNLYDGTGKLVASTVTNATGNYFFPNLIPGDYQVGFANIPKGSMFSPQTTGSDLGLDSNVDSTTGLSEIFTLNPGENNQTIDAGVHLQGTAGLGNYVWEDQNKDGLQTEGEQAVSGVTVSLKNSAGVIIAIAVTDANGYYSFPNLEAGLYSVEFSNLPVNTAGSPATFTTSNVTNQTTNTNGVVDYLDSDANSLGATSAITLNAGEYNPGIDAGIILPWAFLGDYVWFDQNNDGIQNPLESSFAGVEVILYASDGTTILARDTTDALGKYLFPKLIPGTYVVGLTPPTGYILSSINTGTNDSLDSDFNRLSLKTAQVVLLAGDNNLTLDAGIYPVGSIGDTMFVDANDNGIQDVGEGPVPNQKVYLLNVLGLRTDSTTTNAAGYYIFDKLISGTYSIEFTKPAGSLFAKTDIGADGKDSDANTSTAKTGTFTIDTSLPIGNIGRDNRTVDAGIVPLGTIGNYVWNDVNKDGIQTGESGLGGVKVYLLNNLGVKIDSAITNGSGAYLFDSVKAGTFTVQFNVPAGYEVSPINASGDPTTDSDGNATGLTAAITLAPTLGGTSTATHNLSIDLGISVLYGSIGDTMFVDANDNGLQDVGEGPVPNQKVYLLNVLGLRTDSTTTNAAGYFIFDKLISGSYSIEFTKPAGSLFAKSDIGADGKDSDANTSTAKTGNYNIDTSLPIGNIGRDNRTVDAGIVPLGTIGNYVWNDVNKDGIQTGESGLGGVKVYLLNNLGVKIDSAITNGSGAYLFDSVKAGIFTVQFNVPAGYEVSPINASGDPTTDSDGNTAGLTAAITLAPTVGGTSTATNNLSIDLGISVLYGSIGDTMFVDANDNGIQDLGEAIVPNQKVYLLNVLGLRTDSTTTNAAGYYIFDKLISGTYSIEFTKPAGTLFAKKDVGVDGDDSDANTTTGRTGTYSINTELPSGFSGRDNTSVDAGISPLGKIGSLVWIDADGDGQKDPTEVPVGNVRVYLLDNSGNRIDSTLTNPITGAYEFDSVRAGTYKVQFIKPAGYVFTQGNQGPDDTDSDAGYDGVSSPIVMNPSIGGSGIGSINPTVFAGLSVPASLGNYVWYDTDLDGVNDPGELPIANVRVELYDDAGNPARDADGNLVFADSTDTNGIYGFANLLPGSPYVVKFISPAGNAPTVKNSITGTPATDSDAKPNGETDPITLQSGENNPDIDAGFGPTLGTIGNYVFFDKDKSGGQSAGDTPIPGVKIYLYSNTSGLEIDSTESDVNGAYKFDTVAKGDYFIKFIVPNGYKFTRNDFIGDDNLDSDADSVTGITAVFSMDPTPGGTTIFTNNPTLDVGFLPLNPLSADLVSFAAKPKNIGNVLTWKAKNETGFSHFEIMKSATLQEFISIGKVEGGSTTGSYQYLDQKDVLGLNYYQLKMVDLDGSVSYSKIIAVNNKESLSGLLVFPNPSPTREFTIQTDADVRNVRVYNTAGAEIEFEQQKRTIGLLIKLNNQLSSGTYLISIQTSKGLITRRVVIE